MTVSEHSSICRFCNVGCPITVSLEEGRVVRTTGNRESPAFHGFCCTRGQALPEQLLHPDRLLHSRRREGDGNHRPIGATAAMDEVTEKIERIVRAHGPRSVALYLGTYNACYPLVAPVAVSWAAAIGTPMIFTPMTIDQPGKDIANALAGTWEAGPHGFNDADTWLIVGGNPLVAIGVTMPAQNPGRRLKDALQRGMKLIVIDPRRTQTAQRASVHVQPRPGEDASILAAMIHVILAESLHDMAFVQENADGVEALRRVVAPFTPDYAAQRAAVSADEIRAAARTFAGARRGIAVGSTGANMSGHSSLIEYLLTCLNILCGRYLRAGEAVDNPGVLLARATPRAQPVAPRPARNLGEVMAARGLTQAACGMPTAALAEEILAGKVKALLCIGGNPAVSWPDQNLTVRALGALDLLVQFDIRMTPTAQLAHYVIAPKISIEVPTASWGYEKIEAYGSIYSMAEPFGMYAPRLVDPPAGSDLIEEWEFFYGMAQRMGLQLHCAHPRSNGATQRADRPGIDIDMSAKPTTDEMLELLTAGSRIPFSEVKRHPDGALFPEVIRAVPKDAACTARFDVGNGDMMAELDAIVDAPRLADRCGDRFPFLLVCRRSPHLNNSGGLDIPSLQRKGGIHNPAFLHPADLDALRLEPGAAVTIRSEHGSISAIVQPDETMRAGVISMSHAFGLLPDAQQDFRRHGSNTSQLTSVADDYDSFSGMPRMSAVPVQVSGLREATAMPVIHDAG
jgi:anaerobic selenocysteine-containing dehydrogenase